MTLRTEEAGPPELAVGQRPEDEKLSVGASYAYGLQHILTMYGGVIALPVIEGKARFTQFAGVDAWPVCLDTQDTETIIEIVRATAPVYGGINLEDISAPRCFGIEARLREMLDIPVFHDDQHGTAIVTLAALTNALRVVGKELADAAIVVSGVGAAGNAIIRLLHAQGARRIVGVDRRGALNAGMQLDREGDPGRAWIADNTNSEGMAGSLKEVLAGADVFIGVSAPHLLTGGDVATMAEGAIVCAMANPVPEVDPIAAARTAAVQDVAVPRSKRGAEQGAKQAGRVGA